MNPPGLINAVFTIVAKNYLSYARNLMESLRRHAPDMRRVVILADQPDGFFDPAAEHLEVVLTSQLDIPDSRWFHFKYSVLELCTGVKPYAIDYLFRQLGAEQVVYFDPDIQVYGPLNLPGDANIVLTPHLTSPVRDDRKPGELDILLRGTYNLGFIGLNKSSETDRFVAWWKDKLADACRVDLAHGMFVDQRWVDLVPGLFEGVHILRDPQYNIAYWNLADRLEVRPIFFHFSGFDPENPSEFSRYQDRFRLESAGFAGELALRYRDDLLRYGYLESKSWPYAYAVPDLIRQIERLPYVDDPFSSLGFDAITREWNQAVTDLDGRQTGLTRLAYKVYQSRPDIQAAMPDVLGTDAVRFLQWFVESGAREHGLLEAFVQPVRDGLRGREQARHRVIHEKILRTVGAYDRPVEVDWLNEMHTGGPLRLTRLARSIYDSRPELRQSFPDPEGRDAAGFLTWLLSYGVREYRLDDVLVAPMREQWRRVVGKRVWWDARRWAMSRPGKKQSQQAAGPLGANFTGYVRSEMGVGESVRCSIRSARAAGLGVAVKGVDFSGPYRLGDRSMDGQSEDARYPVNIFQVNADQADAVVNKLGSAFTKGKRNVGYWVWELEEFPSLWEPAFRHFDEIWAPTSFCQAAFAERSPVPVIRVPYGVQVDSISSLGRDDFGIPRDRFTFLAMFDLLSVPERKNPLGMIEAFREVPDCHLVLKVNHASERPAEMARIVEAASGLSVTIIDRTLDRADVNALVNCCDCLLSLHRSEGFGLAVAEAMYLGKPVVVTDYSGTRDFTSAGNSFLVGYDRGEVPHGCEPYRPGAFWAEPRKNEAIEQMRVVASFFQIREERARRGAETVRRLLSPARVGGLMRDRLETLRSLS